MTPALPFMSLVPGADADAVRGAIDRVVARGWFVLGPELEAFEAEFAAASGLRACVGVGTGTDALALALRVMGIGPGDEVITSPLSAAFSAMAIVMAGATPVFADIDPDRLTVTPDAIEDAITSRTVAIMPVHLYGQPADMTAIASLAGRRGLALFEDACQAHLATCAGRPVGAFGTGAGISFYPTKNLGALGDGGAVLTNDADFADRLRRIRNGGQAERYRHVEYGVNSRLDELQAAILRSRLTRLADGTATRRVLAARYRERLARSGVTVPPECDPGHVYHLFPILVEGREAFQASLAAEGIGTLVHYPFTIPQQPAFAHLSPSDCPVAERVAASVCSLPLHPGLDTRDVDRVADAVARWRAPAGSA